MSSTAKAASGWVELHLVVKAYQVVVMGVSGCGKSTVGSALAQALGVPYIEGDELHPPGNIERMAAGVPLTDADRHGWLQAVARQLGSASAQERGVVVSCSALKRSYRDLLRAAAPALRFVYLHGTPAQLAQRMQLRTGHYMPASLLQSQIDTLEPPGAEEAPVVVSIEPPPAAIVAQAVRQLQAGLS